MGAKAVITLNVEGATTPRDLGDAIDLWIGSGQFDNDLLTALEECNRKNVTADDIEITVGIGPLVEA